MSRPELDLDELLPELHLIEDAELRHKVQAIWQEMWSESAFDDILDLPISPKVPTPHLPHNRSVITMAVAMADAIERFHSVTVDRDTLVAAALLQDVSKLVEMQPGQDGPEYSEIGRNFQHGFWGAHKALDHDLPLAVCEIVLNHTPDAPRFPASLEGKILWYADQLDVIAVFGDRWVKHLFNTR
jgi:HD superfamily phosphodiesterase